jgi:hypothetical protein
MKRQSFSIMALVLLILSSFLYLTPSASAEQRMARKFYLIIPTDKLLVQQTGCWMVDSQILLML